MAGFDVHVSVASVVGGVGVTILMGTGQADPQIALICFFATMIGGVLPDVDADESIPLRLAFTFFAMLASFLVMFSYADGYSILELIVLWLLMFLFVRLVVLELFTRTTSHRGIFHSLPAGVLFACVTAILLSRLFHHSAKLSWLAGLFVLLGYVVHLLLDELYSLNLLGAGGVSSSFGSAFKLYSNNIWVTCALYAAIAVLFLFTPSLAEMVDAVFNQATWNALQTRWVPTGAWFGLPFLSISSQSP